MAAPAHAGVLRGGASAMARVWVGALLIEVRGDVRILLGKRAAARTAWPGVWDVPGGHREPGEAPEQTLIREVREELGVTPTAWSLLARVCEPAPGHGDPMVLYLYAVTAWEGAPQNRLPEEHAEIAWFGVAAACDLDLASPGYPALFRRLAARCSSGAAASDGGRGAD